MKPDENIATSPLTIEQIEKAEKERLARIDIEFKQGFKFIKDYLESVTFFGSSRARPGDESYEKAKSLAKRIVLELGYAIVTGGGPGIMEAANHGAYEAKGKSIGLTIKIPDEQTENKYLTDKMNFYYFFSRKVLLSFAAEAYIFFPGGFGTMDEFFEIVTLVQTRKVPPLPIILVGKDYWTGLNKFIEENIFRKNGAIDEEDMAIYTITEDEDEIIKLIKDAKIRA